MIVVLAVAMPGLGWAAPTKLVSYQGRITDSNGQPIADGAYSIRFKIYSTSADCTGDTASNLVWGPETQATVQVTNGLFSAVLGSVTSMSAVVFDSDYWIQVKVGANPVFSPCDRLTTAPFAANAINTDSCNSDAVCETTGLTVSANATLGDASGDSVTVNAGAFNFASTTTTSLNNVANAWNIDSNTLSIDALNNRVGIGTASPSVALEVAGSAVHSQNNFIAIGDAAGTGNRAYLSSGGAYSSLSYNAYYAGGASWVENVDVSPDFAFEIDAASATKAFRFFYAPGAAGAPAWSEVATITSAGNMTILGDITVTGGDVAGTASNALACSADATCDTKDVVPIANNTYASGSSTNRWTNVYGVVGNYSGDLYSSLGVRAGGTGDVTDGAIAATQWIGAGCEGNCESAGGYTISYPDGHIDMGGTAGGLRLGAQNWTDAGATFGHVVSDNGTYKALMIVGNNIVGNSGKGREVKVWDYLNVQGDFNATGVIRENGNRIAKCTSVAVSNGVSNWCPAAGWFAASFVNTSGTNCITPYEGIQMGWGWAHQVNLDLTDCFTGSLFCCTKY